MKQLIIIPICLTLIACDGGLAPPPPKPPVELGFSGTIYYAPGSWPPVDSLVNLMIFASQIYPLDSSLVSTGLFSDPPTIFLYPQIGQSLSFFEDSTSYSFPLKSGTYKYIGVLQQLSSDMLTYGIRVFRVVGFYRDPLIPSQPGSVVVNDTSQIEGININVDFQNPPAQPF
jgi:hypothetical protein